MPRHKTAKAINGICAFAGCESKRVSQYHPYCLEHRRLIARRSFQKRREADPEKFEKIAYEFYRNTRAKTHYGITPPCNSHKRSRQIISSMDIQAVTCGICLKLILGA